MAFNGNELGVINTYVAITGEAPTQSEFEAAFEKTGVDALATDLLEDRPQQSNQAFVESMYQNLLGRAADEQGLEYWTSLLAGAGASDGPLSKAKVAAIFQYVAGLNADSEDGFVDGSAGLSSIDGEFADKGPEDPDEVPDDVIFEFDFDTTKGESSVKGWTHEKSDETGDVSEPTGADDYMSNTHKIYNVGMQAIDQGSPTISANYTFRTENQLGDHGHYEAYFLSPILNNTVTNLGTTLTIEVIDRMAEAMNKDAALSLVAIQSFSFRLNGEEIVVGSDDILNATTYEELEAAIQAEIEALADTNEDLEDVSVELGGDFTRQQVDADTLETTGANVLGTQIIITATGSNLIERGGFTFGERSGVDRNVDPSGRQDTEVLGSESSLISTNLEFKNVGYGSQGGSVNVSGQSLSETGVQEFNIVAEKHDLDLGVWLTELSSQPLKNRALNTLEVINLTGAADYFHVGREQSSALLADGGRVVDGKADAGITDVRVFNASEFGQNVRINAEVTENVVARDLDRVDTDGNPVQDNVVYTYNLGNGDNDLYLSFSQEVIAHEDASLSISSGTGDDQVHLVLDNDATPPGSWQENQKDLGNITISTGSGDDTVWTQGAGDALIMVGAGNDTVYTDNSGFQSVGGVIGDVRAHWVFNSFDNDITDLLGGDNASGDPTSTIGDSQTGPYFLYNSTITVTFTGAQNAAPFGGGVTDDDAVALDNGFESTVTLDTPLVNGFGADERHINQAIKEAINNDPVLNKLLVAFDGPNNTLVVESLIDGQFDPEDLRVDIQQPDTTGWSTAEVQAASNAWVNFPGNDSNDALADAAAVAGIYTSAVNSVAGNGANGEHQGLTNGNQAVNNSQLAEVAGGATAPVPGTAATAVIDASGLTLDGTANYQFDVAGNIVAGSQFANLADLATAIAALADVNTAVVNGTDIDVTYVVAPNGGANPGVAITVDEDTTNDGTFGDITSAATVTAGTDGTPGTGLITGANSGEETNNVINLGTGQDVVALSTNDLSNEVLNVTGYNNGDNTIVNFSDTGSSIDFLDFTAYLGTQYDFSGSGSNNGSVGVIPTQDVVSTGDLGANGVAVVSFTANTADNETFAGLTAQNLLAALNNNIAGGSADYGNLGNGVDLDAADLSTGSSNQPTGGDFLSATQGRDHLIFVENSANHGEYKVFELTSNRDLGDANADATFDGAQLIGTYDFGESLTNWDQILVG